MVIQIIKEKGKPTGMQKFSEALGTGLEGAQKLYKEHLQAEALKEQGIDPNLSPEMQQIMMEYKLKGGQDISKYQQNLEQMYRKNQYDQEMLNQKNQYQQELQRNKPIVLELTFEAISI